MHPSAAGSFQVSGSSNVTIYGGPQRSVQVNSSNSGAASGGGTIDLTNAGPSQTGGDFAVFGGPSTPLSGFTTGSTGKWIYPASAFADPYAQTAQPSKPANAPAKTTVNFGVNGCPDPLGCDEYHPGAYAADIKIKSGGAGKATAIFDPGLYWLSGALTLDSGSTARPSCIPAAGGGCTTAADGSDGATFFFSTTSTVSVNANSGKSKACTSASVGTGTPNGCVVSFRTDGNAILSVTSPPVTCAGAPAPPGGLPTTVDGNVLLGPCAGPMSDPLHQYRGFLFFQNRQTAAAPQWGGGGQFLLAGLLYLHQCRSSDTSGTNCSAFGTTMTMNGNSGAQAYTIGNIVTDQLQMSGSPKIHMILNPSASQSILKVQVLQ
jgi:hypothetical protein